jgi:hypothetical protein
MLDHEVVARAAHEHANGLPADEALQRAVIMDARDSGLLTEQQIKEVYHGDPIDLQTPSPAGRVQTATVALPSGGGETPAPQRGGARPAAAGGGAEGERVPGTREASPKEGAQGPAEATGGAKAATRAEVAPRPVGTAAKDTVARPAAEAARAVRAGGADGGASSTSAEPAGTEGKRLAGPARAAAGVPEGAPARGRQPAGPAKAAPGVKSLAQFIAQRGGLKPDAEWNAIGLDYKSRVVVPGLGPRQLVSGKRGMTTDELVDQLEAAHYLPPGSRDDPTIMRRVRDMVDEEVNRKRPQWPIGHEPTANSADRGERLHEARGQIEAEMGAAKLPVERTLPEDLTRATELMVDEHLPPLEALERASVQNELSEGLLSTTDVRDAVGKEKTDVLEPSAAPGDRGEVAAEGARAAEAAPVAGAGEGRPAPGAGEGGREPATERTAAGEQRVIPGAEREPERVTAQRAAERGLKPKVEQLGGLFGNDAKQTDLVERVAEVINEALGDTGATGVTVTPASSTLSDTETQRIAAAVRERLAHAEERRAGVRETPRVAPTPDVALARALVGKVKAGEPITNTILHAEAAKAYGGTLAEGKFDRKDAHDALETAVNMLIRSTPNLRLSGDRPDVKGTLGRLEAILDKTPTQTVRSEEQQLFQQFSTPPHYSAAVAYAAALRPGDRVLEPSAGTGSLVAAASRPDVSFYANELAPRRVALLRELLGPSARVTTENAEQLHNILPVDIRPTVVVMNPPFSQTAGRMGTKRVIETGAVHIEQALNRLEPGGRLVAIVGRGMGMDAPAFRDWWKKVASRSMAACTASTGPLSAPGLWS